MIKEGFSKELLASYIDHTLLRPQAQEADILKLCSEANDYGFSSVCVAPVWAEVIAQKGSLLPTVHLCTVINFPFGNHFSLHKTLRDELISLKTKVDEFDIVLPLGFSLDLNNKLNAIDDYLAVCTQALYPKTTKLIIETSELPDDTIIELCKIAMRWRINFVKTSTGFASAGANVRVVELMRKAIGDEGKIKASGGIKTFQQTKDLIAAGADRIGTSNAIAIIKEWEKLSAKEE